MRIGNFLCILLSVTSLIVIFFHNSDLAKTNNVSDHVIFPPTSSSRSNFLVEVQLEVPPSNEVNPPNTITLSVLMVESRPDPRIAIVLSQCDKLLNDTPMVLIHSNQNENFVKSQSLILSLFRKKRLRLRCLFGCSMNVVVGGGASYSELLFRVDFWQTFKSSHILVVQTDSWLCSPSPGIPPLVQQLQQLALNYDFIGAPDSPNHFNGGFSLRSRSAMLSALRELPPPSGYHAEDVYFSRALTLLSVPIVTSRPHRLNFTCSMVLQMKFKGILTSHMVNRYTKLSHSAISGAEYKGILVALAEHPKGLKLEPFPFTSHRMPSYTTALKFALRSGEGKGGHATWRRDGEADLPIGVHLSEGVRNPNPSQSLVSSCVGLGAILTEPVSTL